MKDFFGLLGTLIALTAYGLYFRDIFSRNIKPHAFSWLVWAVTAGIGFAAQVVGQAGAGSWVLGGGYCRLFLYLFSSADQRRERLYSF